jgi:hypothetical protein
MHYDSPAWSGISGVLMMHEEKAVEGKAQIARLVKGVARHRDSSCGQGDHV